MLKTILRAVALAAAVLASVPAAAQDRSPDVRVHYGDLDLSKPADVKRLDHRLAYAVAAACPSDNGVREMSRLQTIERCRAAKQAEIAPRREAALAAASGSQTTLAAAR